MKIALISDIHFGKDSRTKEFTVPGEPMDDETEGGASLEKGLIEHFTQHKVEYLFIAGDLTSLGSPQEFYYCKKKIFEIANASNISKDHVICSLGNHDIDRKVSALYKEEHERFVLDDKVKELVKNSYCHLSAFASYLNLEELGQYDTQLCIPNVFIKEEDDFIVFVLNSSWDGGPHQDIVPHGKLSRKQIEWFEKSAGNYINDNRYKIVLMHHHPIQYQYPVTFFDCSMIEDGDEFMEAAARNKINLIIHGHRHHPVTQTIMKNGWNSPITLICAGSVNVNYKQRSESPNTMHIIDIEKDKKTIDLFNYEYSNAAGWKSITYSKEKPLDSKMHLGKLITDHELDLLVENCIKKKRRWEWDELPEDVRFRPFKDINNSFRKIAGSSMVGAFPELVYILSEEEINQ